MLGSAASRFPARGQAMETLDVQPGSAVPQEAEERAYKLSLQADPAVMTRFLLESVGPRVTAACLGMADARQLRRWGSGLNQPRQSVLEDRLRVLFRVTHEITAVYGAATAAAFLRSANPQLDDNAPLLVLRTDGDDDTVRESLRQVIAAARAFLEG